ncbi:hypothetical protein V6N13_058979 [Hibiscus sabdariffa]|uniref:Uncharacterized protein n=1 Tax=Hibiscus sabdariffa TaxID=183260 RepID=A0ABR2GFR5_9ROSI
MGKFIPWIVHFNAHVSKYGKHGKVMEFVGENEIAPGSSLMRGKSVMIFDIRNISVKRFFKGKNEVCNLIGPKKTKSCSVVVSNTIEGGVEVVSPIKTL